MFKNIPVTLLITAGLLIVLIVLAGILPLFGGIRGLGMNLGKFENGRSNFDSNNLPQGFNPPEGFNPGSGSNFEGNPNLTMPAGNINMKLIQLIRGVQVGGGILIAALGILSIVGIMLNKKWGRGWAIVTSVLVFAITIPSLFQRLVGLTIVEILIKIIFIIAIVFLCLLPKSRQATAPVTV
ncbi:MAG: hypothetical protein C0401_02580 [Anaerolinea sp.]|nr:hypothetical protein [Anaerolinea sp.]